MNFPFGVIHKGRPQGKGGGGFEFADKLGQGGRGGLSSEDVRKISLGEKIHFHKEKKMDVIGIQIVQNVVFGVKSA